MPIERECDWTTLLLEPQLLLLAEGLVSMLRVLLVLDPSLSPLLVLLLLLLLLLLLSISSHVV